MKCSFPPGENVCKRCRSGKHDCIVEGRKPRSAPNKREYLLAQLRQKDAIIESLLKQMHNPFLATPLSIEAYRTATPSADRHRQDVIAWLDRLQSSVRAPARATPTSATTPTAPFAFRAHGAGEESDSDEPPMSAHTLVEPDALEPASAGAGVDFADDAVPLGLLANLAISTSKDGAAAAAAAANKPHEAGAEDDVGVANRKYFMPGPSSDLRLRRSLIDKTSPPDILVHGLVTPEDVEKLFEIFYTRINPFISLLEPKLHTPAQTFSRCPFLFTVVCAIASRYSDKPEVYPIAMHFAKSAAAHALVDGWKSVELCQAYILMSIYAVPARRWEEDRSWLYTGLAIRIATDLNLHLLPPKKPATEQEELELLNRTRIWIICFNLDKSTATQFGKPSTLKEDYIMRNSLEWYKSSPHNHPYDVHIIAYSALFRIINAFHTAVFSDPNTPSGLNRAIDFRAVTLEHDVLLRRCREEWVERFARDSDHNDAASEFRVKLLPFYSNYARLVMFSFGFQKAFQRGFEADDEVFFTSSLESAKSVVTVLVDSLVPTGYIRFAPDGYFVFAAFASAFMLKLLRPECARFITPGLETEIHSTIERLINTLGAPHIAIDERHTPKLYSRFLASLLAKHRRDGAARGRMHTQGPPAQQASAYPAQSQPQPQQQQQAPPPPPVPQQQQQQQQQQQHGGQAQGVTSSEPVYQLEAPSFTFGSDVGPTEAMDFTFDTISAPGSEDLLAAMKVIQSPAWLQTMMMPGFSWPAEQDSVAFFGGGEHALHGMGAGLPNGGYLQFQPQGEVPVHLG
ncbi:fungal-specific transcription factor domain-containing protein [Gloeopeniophorella convolvens]|nr:fungal-specific transcription factor domain-containing protein [Gloeopeniophorella convolvens]